MPPLFLLIIILNVTNCATKGGDKHDIDLSQARKKQDHKNSL